MKNNQVYTVSDNVKWVGILDYDIVTFDVVMKTDLGTTYNSYFIDADKKVIIDTSKETFKDEYIEKIKSVVDPAEISYIILNHTEPDITGESFPSLKVKNGDELDLGNFTLKFIGAPNLHWPDTMYTYLVEEKILFTCDSFGCHYCNSEMFDDKVENFDHAFDYYFDVILKPYSKFMLKAIERIRPLEINAICPGHGPVLRSYWKKYVDRSEQLALEYLSNATPQVPLVLIVFVSAYGYTKEMAVFLAEGIKQAGEIETELMDLEASSLGEMEEKMIRNSALVVGSPTINQNTLLPVYKLFSIVNPIRDKGKPAAAFGSFGWSGEAIGIVEENLKQLKFKLFDLNASYKFYPQDTKANEIRKFGKRFGDFVLKSINEKVNNH